MYRDNTGNPMLCKNGTACISCIQQIINEAKQMHALNQYFATQDDNTTLPDKVNHSPYPNPLFTANVTEVTSLFKQVYPYRATSPDRIPYLIKDTLILEKIQRQATKFILSDYVSDYKTRLLKLDLLPLMYILHGFL